VARTPEEEVVAEEEVSLEEGVEQGVLKIVGMMGVVTRVGEEEVGRVEFHLVVEVVVRQVAEGEGEDASSLNGVCMEDSSSLEAQSFGQLMCSAGLPQYPIAQEPG
jgi:hypothetical protein